MCRTKYYSNISTRAKSGNDKFPNFGEKLNVISKSYILKYSPIKDYVKKYLIRGAWVAQSVKRPTLAQVMILLSVSSSPTSGSVLTAQSLEPALVSVSPSLSMLLPCSHPVSLSRINKEKLKKKNCFKKYLMCRKTKLESLYTLMYFIDT